MWCYPPAGPAPRIIRTSAFAATGNGRWVPERVAEASCHIATNRAGLVRGDGGVAGLSLAACHDGVRGAWIKDAGGSRPPRIPIRTLAVRRDLPAGIAPGLH